MKYFLYFSTSLAAVMAAQPAPAQDAGDEGIGDIVVTAQRREERLQDVPLAVSALNAEQLKAQGIGNVGDLGTGRVPGLTVNSGSGSESTFVLNMRGFGPSDAVQGTVELPVALYIDGVPLARAQGSAMDLITPERIEVLRGPQGQLFGRNAEAGAVQVISRRPSGEPSAELTTGFGNFGMLQLKGRVDLPELAGFRIQLSGNFRKRGGYYDNIRNPNLQDTSPANNPLASFHYKTMDFDGDLQRMRTWGGRAAVERDFGELNVYYSFDYGKTRDDQGYAAFLNSPKNGTIFNPAGGTGPMSYFTNADGGTTPTVFLYQPFDGEMPKSVPFALPSNPFYTKASGHMLTLTYPATDQLTLRSIFGTRFVQRQGISATPPTNALIPSAYEYMRSRSYSGEFQAIYDGERLKVTGGGTYFTERVMDERESLFSLNCSITPAGPCTQNGFPSRPGWSLSAGSAGFKRSFSRSNVFGVYAQATYTPPVLDDRLELTAGARYSNDEKEGDRRLDYGLNPATGIVSLHNRFATQRVDPAFTIKYKLSEDANIYARYAVGYRAGGSSVRSPTFQSFSAESLTSYEVGLKSDLFDRRVRFNLAAFYGRVKGQQVSLQSDPSLNPGFSDFFNIPMPRKIKGLEAELIVKPAAGLTFSGSYTFLDVNKVAFGLERVVAGVPPRSFVVNGTWNDITGLIPDAATIAAHPNSTMVYMGPQSAPRHAGSIAADYRFDLGSGQVSLHADWQRASRHYTAAPYIYTTLVINGVATPQARFNAGDTLNRVNGSISYKDELFGGTEAEIRLWMKNVFNHADRTYAFAAGNAINTSTPYPNSVFFLMPPRTFGADLTVSF